MTLAKKIIRFNEQLNFSEKLPSGIRIMNPFKEPGYEKVMALCQAFYHKYYNDTHTRKLILGINPGRHGAALTGIPFTDGKRLQSHCGIETNGLQSHEPSSVFVYDMIQAYGGLNTFFQQFFINSICPLGFVINNNKGREVNYNYYDLKELQNAVLPFIKKSIKQMIVLGLDTSTVYCWGNGKNHHFLEKLNQTEKYFDKIIPLEHPRYIMQYKSKEKDAYIQKYLDAFGVK